MKDCPDFSFCRKTHTQWLAPFLGRWDMGDLSSVRQKRDGWKEASKQTLWLHAFFYVIDYDCNLIS